MGDADITDAQEHMNRLRIRMNDPDEQGSKEAEAQLRRITEARADRGRAIQAAHQEYSDRNSANNNGTRQANGNQN